MGKTLSSKLSPPHQPPKLALFPLRLWLAPCSSSNVLYLPTITWNSFTLKSRDSEQLEVWCLPPPNPVSTANQLLNLSPCYPSSPSRYLEMLFSISSPWSRNMVELHFLSFLKFIMASHMTCFGQEKVGRGDTCCFWWKYLVAVCHTTTPFSSCH